MNHNRSTQVWQTLRDLANQDWQLSPLFLQDPQRGSRFSASACDLYLDYSKQCLNEAVLTALLDLAQSCQLADRIHALQRGDIVNPTENRPALHTALRLPKSAHLLVNGSDVVTGVHESLQKAATMVDRLRKKAWRGFSGKAITDVVNIGVGGSDLGPLMAVTALDEWADTDIEVHFISNMDGSQLARLLKNLSPETTLFIISSKSFGTSDTFSNAETAMAWLKSACPKTQILLQHHFIAISANPKKMQAWGVPPSNQLNFWEWVGGRFSMWSAIGLAIAIKIDMANFYELLAGAHEMDQHFANADFAHNLPVLLGLIGVWNSTFLGINAHTVLPYDGRLRYFPNYLMQLEMESNGKSVSLSGDPLDYHTAPVMWGEVGSNAQHAFYQLLHQGTQKVSCDFIAPILRPLVNGNPIPTYHDPLQTQHQLALANCLAQSRVLAFGNLATHKNQTNQTDNLQNQHKHYRGNQPSTTILLNALTPKTLGALIALYEHKVFVMASLWQINPFDQWGVEIGKVMANQLYDVLAKQDFEAESFDSSTETLLKKIFSIH